MLETRVFTIFGLYSVQGHSDLSGHFHSRRGQFFAGFVNAMVLKGKLSKRHDMNLVIILFWALL